MNSMKLSVVVMKYKVFLDNKGKFYNREEAAMLFNSYSDKKVSKLLFSEDLY